MVKISLEELVSYQHAMAAWRTYYRTAQADPSLDFRRTRTYNQFLRRGPPVVRRIRKVYHYNPDIMEKDEYDALLDALEEDFGIGRWKDVAASGPQKKYVGKR